MFELSGLFWQQYFLVGFLLIELVLVFEFEVEGVFLLYKKVISVVYSLLCGYDIDFCYVEVIVKVCVVELYLLLLLIVWDILLWLYDFVEGLGQWLRLVLMFDLDIEGEGDIVGIINFFVVMVIVGGFLVFGFWVSIFQGLLMVFCVGCVFFVELSWILLVCVLWVLKNVELVFLQCWVVDLIFFQLGCFLDLLYFCLVVFEYKGKKVFECINSFMFKKLLDMKVCLEEVILGIIGV